MASKLGRILALPALACIMVAGTALVELLPLPWGWLAYGLLALAMSAFVGWGLWRLMEQGHA